MTHDDEMHILRSCFLRKFREIAPELLDTDEPGGHKGKRERYNYSVHYFWSKRQAKRKPLYFNISFSGAISFPNAAASFARIRAFFRSPCLAKSNAKL